MRGLALLHRRGEGARGKLLHQTLLVFGIGDRLVEGAAFVLQGFQVALDAASPFVARG